MQAKDKWIDGIENFNILFENVMRFSTFRVLIEKGAVSEAQAARISQDLTTNFTRRGYKAKHSVRGGCSLTHRCKETIKY